MLQNGIEELDLLSNKMSSISIFYGSGSNWKVVHQSTKVDKSSTNPNWQEQIIDLGNLCCNDVNLPLRLSVYHHRSCGKHILMGEVETSVNGLIAVYKSSSRLQISNKGFMTGSLMPVATISMRENHDMMEKEETIEQSLSMDEEGSIVSVSSDTENIAFTTPCIPSQSQRTTDGFAQGKLSKELSTESMLFTSSSTINCI